MDPQSEYARVLSGRRNPAAAAAAALTGCKADFDRPSKLSINEPIHIRPLSPDSLRPNDDASVMQMYPQPCLAAAPDPRHANAPRHSRKRRQGSDSQLKDLPRPFSPSKAVKSRGYHPLSPDSPEPQIGPPRSGLAEASQSRPFNGSPQRRLHFRQQPTPPMRVSKSDLIVPIRQHRKHPPAQPDPRSSNQPDAQAQASMLQPQEAPQPPHSFGPNRTVQNVIDSHGANPPPAKPRPPLQDPAEDDELLNSEDEQLEPNPSPLIKQPESRPISQQQLAAEVKGIYSGLVMLESKCIEIITGQAAQPSEPGGQPTPYPQHIDQFQALIALHRTLLYEHHDFLLASQHPSASPIIKGLAAKYAMPARMWKHGIHNFLELLRHRLPASLDYMLAFIILAYQMMALLYDTVPAFEETWIECLGDLARYRMAVEDEDLRDREIWTGVARMWYLRAVDKDAGVGRLYHHLAILSRHNPVQQLSSYCRALTANTPFLSTRDSVLTLFEPSLNRWRDQHTRTLSIDTWFVVTHAVMFLGEPVDQLQTAVGKFLGQLNDQISRVTVRWRDAGAFIAAANIGGILKYGCTDSGIRAILSAGGKALSQQREVLQPERDGDWPDPDETPSGNGAMPHEWHLAVETLSICLRRTTDPNVLPHIHVMLVFLWRLAQTPAGALYVAAYTPWQLLAAFLNQLMSNLHVDRVPDTDAFPIPRASEERVPLLEDFLMNGQVWANGYFPETWFARASADLDERAMERPATSTVRGDRVLWIAARLALSVARAFGRDDSDEHGRAAADRAGVGRCNAGRWLRFEPGPMPDGPSFVAGPGGMPAFADARHARKMTVSWHQMRRAEADRGRGAERAREGGDEDDEDEEDEVDEDDEEGDDDEDEDEDEDGHEGSAMAGVERG